MLLSLKKIFQKNRLIFENIFFVGIVQIFGLLAPLITYPYLVKTLGMDLYGVIISAQVLVSYATLIIDFGSNSVCAKNVSINRDNPEKLSEIVCSVLSIRFILWVLCLFIYSIVVISIPTYKEYLLLFLLSYLMTTNELLFPQFYFQGIENMKTISLISILIKVIFILLVFVFVKEQPDYLFVPVLYAVGYSVAGIISVIIIFKRHAIKLSFPKPSILISYFKEASPILATDLVCTIKDKFNYILLGTRIGMGEVVVYDLGLKLMGFAVKPANIIATVLLPRFAKSRNKNKLGIILLLIGGFSLLIAVIVNIFLEPIVYFFLHQTIDLLPIRLFTLIPVFLSPSILLASNFFIGFGYNKYLLYSIIVTTIVYLVSLVTIWITGYINNIYSFVFLAMISYLVEFIYRMYKYVKLS